VARSPGSRKPDGPEKVLILGGGLAGIGAARKLEEADVDVELVYFVHERPVRSSVDTGERRES